MQKGFTAIFIIVAVTIGIVAGSLVWQYNLYQRLSQKDLSCGGDWSYNVKCPVGSYCQSLNQGELAGGLCKPYLSSLFEVTKTSKSLPGQSASQATSIPSPAPDETDNWKTYTDTNFKFSIKYPSNMIYEEPPNDTYLLLVAFRDPTKSVSADNFSIEVVNSKKLEDEIQYRRWQVEGHIVIKDGIKETKLIDKGYEEAKLEFDIVDPSSNSTQHSVVVILKSEKYNYVVSANSNITNADFIDRILSSFQILK